MNVREIDEEYLTDIYSDTCHICDLYMNSTDFLNCKFKRIFYYEDESFFVIAPIIHNRKTYFDLTEKEREEINQCLWQVSHYLHTTNIKIQYTQINNHCYILVY